LHCFAQSDPLIDENNNSCKDLTTTFKSILNSSLSVASTGLSTVNGSRGLFNGTGNSNALTRTIGKHTTLSGNDGSQTAPSTINSLIGFGKTSDTGSGSLSAGELFRKPLRLESIRSSNGIEKFELKLLFQFYFSLVGV
jgi:hypothetical protein